MLTLRRLIESGVSLRETGRRLHCSARTVYRRVQAIDGIVRRRATRLRPADRRLIVRLARAGEISVRRVATRVGVGWHTVQRVLDTEGLPRLAPVHRCPTCGHTIQLRPCMVCRARSSMQHDLPSQAQTR